MYRDRDDSRGPGCSWGSMKEKEAESQTAGITGLAKKASQAKLLGWENMHTQLFTPHQQHRGLFAFRYMCVGSWQAVSYTAPGPSSMHLFSSARVLMQDICSLFSDYALLPASICSRRSVKPFVTYKISMQKATALSPLSHSKQSFSTKGHLPDPRSQKLLLTDSSITISL